MVILFEELDRSLREFAKQSGRLARLVQRKKTCRLPSEGFSQLVSERMEAVERAFQAYLRRKDELLTYIKVSAWPADHHKFRGSVAYKRSPGRLAQTSCGAILKEVTACEDHHRGRQIKRTDPTR